MRGDNHRCRPSASSAVTGRASPSPPLFSGNASRGRPREALISVAVPRQASAPSPRRSSTESYSCAVCTGCQSFPCPWQRRLSLSHSSEVAVFWGCNQKQNKSHSPLKTTSASMKFRTKAKSHQFSVTENVHLSKNIRWAAFRLCY